tara:strand:- start:326 stop:595 length:270 start_codon:yes stop_codon:yes gene_type:complete
LPPPVFFRRSDDATTILTPGATGAACYGDDGQPRLITGIETLKFHGGTGAFMGLNHGEIAFDVTFDFCTDPTNPVADLKVTSGELCFQE